MECTVGSTSREQQPLSNDAQKGLSSLHSTLKPSLQMLLSKLTAADVKFPLRCINPPPRNRWLVPLRSPSEGLIYKPYAGPCPPNAGLFAPFDGSCGPISQSAACGNFFNTDCCFPYSGRQGMENVSGQNLPGDTYFQPYTMPVINASGVNPTVERIRPFVKAQPLEPDISVPICETDRITPYKSSWKLPIQKSKGILDHRQHLQGSKCSDFQDSTESSPTQEKQGGALSLFPTTPSIAAAYQLVRRPSPEQRIQVIKVVPHKRKSASESAARIFQAILNERKQCE